MIDWNQYHKEVGARIGDLMKVSPDTVRGYQTLSAAIPRRQTGRKDAPAHFAGCCRHDAMWRLHRRAHRRGAESRATKEEISEALGVAVAMNAGAALVYSSRVLDAVEAKSAAAHAG